jgi:hypothetical protein
VVVNLSRVSIAHLVYSRQFYRIHGKICRPGSSVGIATGYGLDGPGIESSQACFARGVSLLSLQNG